MRRLGIFVFYDASGIVDRYIHKLLSGLSSEIEEFAIIVNGEITDESEKKLRLHSDRIFKRDNIGFDAGAYKDAFQIYLKDEDWEQWDEVVLFNDTFYAPIHPWKNVFDRMEQENVDFWGLTKHPEGSRLPSGETGTIHIQSYFLALRKKMSISESFSAFWESLGYHRDVWGVIENFEMGFTSYFEEKGFTGKAYTDICDKQIDFTYGENPYIHKAFELLEEVRLPVLKRKALRLDAFSKTRMILEHIHNYSSYNTKYIYEHFLRLADLKPTKPFDVIKLNRFYDSHESIYIYGHGEYGKNIEEYFLFRGWLFDGFIVSKREYVDGDNVYSYGDLNLRGNEGIILALGEGLVGEVYSYIKHDIREQHLFLLSY